MHERDRFDKFNERARKVLSLSQEEAQRFNHNYIGTEHLLLGLVREGEGVAAQVMSMLGVELQKVRVLVEHIVGRGDRVVLGEIGLTPRAKKVIELAVDEARRLNHHYIGTEHLLLGLLREGEGIAAGVLQSLGVNLEKVRTTTILVLANKGRNPDRAPTQSTEAPIYSSTAVHASGFTSANMREMAVRLRAEADRIEGMAQMLDQSTPPPSAPQPPSYARSVDPEALEVLRLARVEALRAHHDYIGAEHLLLGILQIIDYPEIVILATHGVDLEQTRAALDTMMGHGTNATFGAPLTPRARNAIEIAFVVAKQHQQMPLRPEHILFGVLAAEDGSIVDLLTAMEIDIPSLRAAVQQSLDEPIE